jgi:small subunit ribosomal protein S15
MSLTAEKKKELFAKFGQSEKDTGRAESQIALFTQRITEMTEHMKQQPKDKATERSLIRLVGKRRSLLDFLMKKDINRYRKIISELQIRK